MSPRKEAREPVNENIGKGTGIGTLIPIYRTTKVTSNHAFNCYACMYVNTVKTAGIKWCLFR